MDLAKIRQKARQEQDRLLAGSTQQIREENVSAVSVSNILPPVVESGVSDPEIPSVISPQPSQSSPAFLHSTQTQRVQVRDPLEVIVAGRIAAGCEDEQLQDSNNEALVEVEEYLEYLCFRVSDETYGINIMDIKEIIKPREVTEVPRAPAFVSGVISLRGTIIPIIDMRERLGLQRETVTGKERVIVVRHGESFSGLLVDEIIQVVKIALECLESAPAVLEGIDRDFVNGIGRANGRMIILLNLENVADIHLY